MLLLATVYHTYLAIKVRLKTLDLRSILDLHPLPVSHGGEVVRPGMRSEKQPGCCCAWPRRWQFNHAPAVICTHSVWRRLAVVNMQTSRYRPTLEPTGDLWHRLAAATMAAALGVWRWMMDHRPTFWQLHPVATVPADNGEWMIGKKRIVYQSELSGDD